ncbi:MAG: stage II sporulation protein M [Capsulimonas sp.]|uniref:stage II sporulation protein M n=1 Tax=Capsulimonas sp. TaxID=2494211 RepID=UPI003267D755|nr:putative rane protein [Capsulimonas sp.]
MAIDERAFINKKRANWERLSSIVERTKNGGLRRLSKEELPALGSLYRRAAADLAYARQQEANPNLVLYLNELVGNAHGVIYSEETGGWRRILGFLRVGLPDVLRRRMGFTIAAIIISVIGAYLAYALVHKSEDYLALFLPEGFRSSFDGWKQGFADHGDISSAEGFDFSSQLMTNNTKVGIIAFATGITLILPVLMLLQNGEMMGALIAVVQPTGHLTSMWAGILPHGVAELSAIFICGGAGLCIGWALIAPGKYSRKDALVIAGRDGAKMMVGTIPLFILAGIIEGNISHASLPHWAKFGMAIFQFALLLFYIYGSPRRPKTAAL